MSTVGLSVPTRPWISWLSWERTWVCIRRDGRPCDVVCVASGSILHTHVHFCPLFLIYIFWDVGAHSDRIQRALVVGRMNERMGEIVQRHIEFSTQNSFSEPAGKLAKQRPVLCPLYVCTHGDSPPQQRAAAATETLNCTVRALWGRLHSACLSTDEKRLSLHCKTVSMSRLTA